MSKLFDFSAAGDYPEAVPSTFYGDTGDYPEQAGDQFEGR